jgi:heat shock protein HtpX
MTVYTQVASNRAKTWGYLFIYVALILAIGYFFSYYYGSYVFLLIAGVISIVQGSIGYWFADSIALAVAHAEPLDPERYAATYKIMENLSITAGLPMPRLFLISDPALNAFATGRDPKHAAIAITSGLLESLDSNELTGVLAHELSHVGNEDIRLMSMVMIMAGVITLLSQWFTRSLWWGGGRKRDDNDNGGGGIMLVVGIAFAILAPLAATLIQLAISRRREFMADADGVLLTRYPEGLISALRKIGSDDQAVSDANTATAPMYINNPLRKGGWLANAFSTHPPIEKRIEALEKGTGIHG